MRITSRIFVASVVVNYVKKWLVCIWKAHSYLIKPRALQHNCHVVFMKYTSYIIRISLDSYKPHFFHV